MKRLIGYFVRGSLVLVPLALTIYIVYLVLTTVDEILGLQIPGLGFLITVGLITLVGFLTSNVIGRTVFDITEGLFTRVPLVKLLYTSLRDLIGAFVGERPSFNRPVMVTPTQGSQLRILGFITRDALHGLGLPDHVAVYVPQSYNVAGNVLIVPRSSIEPLDVATSDLVPFIVSGGISGLGVGQSLPPPSVPPRRPSS